MQGLTRLAEFLEDWNYLIQRDGWRAALPVVGQEISSLPYRHLELAVLASSLFAPLPDFQPRLALDIREFEPLDLALVRQIIRPSEVRLSSRRLALGHKGLIALHKGELAGYAWGCSKIDQALERVHQELEPGDVFCVDAYTTPAFRGQGVHTALTLERFRLFRELGYHRAVAYIGINNFPSLAVWRKFGGEIVGYIDFKRIGSWRRVQYT